MRYAYLTDIGCRERNEDNFSVPGDSGIAALFAVADGMGGHAAGQRASEIALRTLERCVAEKNDPAYLEENVRRANREVFRCAQQEEGCAGMGTTLVAVLADERRYRAVNVGDSRLYHFSGGEIHQVTRDHSLVAAYVERGIITPDQAEHHPQRNVITRALGTAMNVEPDAFEACWNAGDLLVLCTDGLCGALSDGKIASVLRSGKSLSGMCDALVKLALQEGAKDNITLVLVQNEGGESSCAQS